MNINKKIQLRSGEEVIILIRRYSLTYLWQYALGLLVMALVSFFLFWLLAQGRVGQIFFGLGIFLGIFIIFRSWFYHHHNFMAITSDRVVDVDRKGWFEEVISSLSHNDIQDVSFIKRGVLSSIFNYGDLNINTKSRLVLELAYVHNPSRLQMMIIETMDKFKSGKNTNDRTEIYRQFLRLVSDLAEEELCEVKDLVDERLRTIDEGRIEE